MTVYLKRSEEEGLVGNLRSNTYHMVKISPLNFSESFIVNKEMTGCTSLPILNSGVTGVFQSSPNLHTM